MPVMAEEEWWKDSWDPMEYGREYDFSRPFFEQFAELYRVVPKFARATSNMENSDYSANAGNLKNCYLVFNADYDEDCLYSTTLNYCRDCVDSAHMSKSERCYGSFWVNDSYQTHFSVQCENCTGVWFSKNCRGCTDCFGCANLTNKKYHFFNEPLSAEEYKKRMQELALHTWKGLQSAQEQAYAFWKKFPNKYIQGSRNENVTGEYVTHSKDVKNGYLIREGENLKYVQYLELPPNKDCQDFTIWGANNQLGYEVMACGYGSYRVRFTFESWTDVQDLEYCAYCMSSSDLFGCVGLRKKKYCILNKQYSEGEFKALREKVISHMNGMPYTDKAGRVYKYGEFFPVELSPHAYNNTIANDHFPLTKDETEKSEFLWYEADPKEFEITIRAEELPDSIKEVTEDILKQTIQCANCRRAYKIIPQELAFLKREGIPAPRHCVDCRTQERLSHRNRSKLFSRSCQCGGSVSENKVYKNISGHFHGGEPCPNTFETAYAPERSEIIYCEACYQPEVE